MPTKLMLAFIAMVTAFLANAEQKNEEISKGCEEAQVFLEKNKENIKNLLNQETDNTDVRLLLDLGKFQVKMLENQLTKKDKGAFLCKSIVKRLKRIINKASIIEKIMLTKENASVTTNKSEVSKTVTPQQESVKPQ